jgi:multidrug resistance efflux pump
MKVVAVLRAVALSPWTLLRAVGRALRRTLRSAWFWILLLLAVVAGLIVYYSYADLYTPFTRDAYVQAFVIQTAPQVEGQVEAVYVHENQLVRRGEVLFLIDPRPFRHRVRELEAKLEQAVKQVAQLEKEKAAAEADEKALAEEEALAQIIFGQEEKIFQKESTTERKYEEAKHKLKAAQALRARSAAQVGQRDQALKALIGDEHAQVAEVRAQLETAKLHLEWTQVVAPADGYVTNLQLRVGSQVLAGKPVLTLIESDQWWVVANFREGNLERLRPGQRAEIAFKNYPGRIFPGVVESVGWGVSQGQGVPSGELPTIKPGPEWIKLSQRFQVRLAAEGLGELPLRVGASASVTVYTSDDEGLNRVAHFWERVYAWLDYLR